MRQRQTKQGGGAASRDHKANGHDTPAIVSIGNCSGNEDQKQRRQKLKKPDQTEIKGVTGHLVHLPAD